ncbi:MAG: hypothetical protein Q9226_003124 [Calogaya cf. arnoldii]
MAEVDIPKRYERFAFPQSILKKLSLLHTLHEVLLPHRKSWKKVDKRINKVRKKLDKLQKELEAHQEKREKFDDMTEARAFDLESLTDLCETNYDAASAFLHGFRRADKVVAGMYDQIEDLIDVSSRERRAP